MIVYINKSEIGVLIENDSYAGILGPGLHWVFNSPWIKRRVERVEAVQGLFLHRFVKQAVNDKKAGAFIQTVVVTDGFRGLYWIDDVFTGFLSPGVHAFFKSGARLKVEQIKAEPGRQIVGVDIEPLLMNRNSVLFLETVVVEPGTVAILEQAGKELGIFEPGRYVFVKTYSAIKTRSVSLRENTLDIQGQDIMTQDKVTLRVNFVVTWKVTDPVRALDLGQDVSAAVYRMAQLALRASVGGRSLDALLEDKESLGKELAQALAGKTEQVGVTVTNIGLRDVILPGEMKMLFNRVLEAQKEAEANGIKRREETAAARSQANTAKLLQENPMLVRIREMELVGQVLTNANLTLVVGQDDVPGKVLSLLDRDKKNG
jgi:regulator of protease activity HflC (stomatin/prohibitin superfamily)